MVRNKEAPKQLDSSQREKLCLNLLSSKNQSSNGSVSTTWQNHHHESAVDFIDLASDEIEAEPPDTENSFQRKSYPKKKGKIQDYGSFENVLKKCEFSVKIECEQFSSSGNDNIHCLFGEMAIDLQDSHKVDMDFSGPVWLYISEECDHSAIYYEWSNDDDWLTPKKSKKSEANNFKYFKVAGTLNVNLWKALKIQRYFQIVLVKCTESTLFLEIYLLKTGLVVLKYPYEHERGNKDISLACSFFYNIEIPKIYEGEKSTKHNVEILYEAIKDLHYEKAFCEVDVQHSNLVPKLRPYQKNAVKWMLYQERIGKELLGNEEDLHPLFAEITCIDNTKLYYNINGYFFTKDKPLQTLSCPGGILADEMGLGKTVEVLACILCHPRENVPKGPITETKSQSQNILSCNADDDDVTILAGKDSLELIPVDNASNVSNVDTSDKANVSIPQHVNSLIKEENVNVEMSPDPHSNGFESVPDETEIIKKGEVSRDKMSLDLQDYEFDSVDDDNDEEYIPKNKKRKVTKRILKNTYNIEEEISQNSVLSVIENIILEKVWNGVCKDYKKEGSFKGFRKFLKRRKTDSYYMMSMKQMLNVQYLSSLAAYSATGVLSRKICPGFFDTKVEQKSFFECFCGQGNERREVDEASIVQCAMCTLSQHADCVHYDLNEPLRGEYICPHCWTLESPVVSAATLIVTPSSISHQWVDEINKHIKEKSLNMFVYDGIPTHGYIQPRTLAKYDIVITSYETLRKEINYVDLPHSNSEAGRKFRFPKRFMSTPSPLPCVEWWRVCLDEAQMVESTTSKTTAMALRLSARNRWCITGTPIQKTVNDLQGLLTFLGVDPFCVSYWWQHCLYDPYCYGDTQPLHQLIAKYMWRSSKKDVYDQLDIPAQSEQIHWLNFTPVEEHFYKRLHDACSSDALRKIRKFKNKSVKLSSLDRQTLNSLLQPLLKLRQACNHPQIVKGQFTPLNRKTLTMEHLLENLIKKTQVEAEEAHRVIVASLNGLAAIDIIKGEFIEAVDKYRKVLQSVEEQKNTFKTDSLQQLHTIHNLAEILQAKHENIQPTLRDDGLFEEAKEIKEDYLKHYPSRISEVEAECSQLSLNIEDLKKNFNSKRDWWSSALESLNDEFVVEVREELLSQYTRFEEHKCILYPIKSKVQLMVLLRTKISKLERQRREMQSEVRDLMKLNPASLLNGSIDCHLRPSDEKSTLCIMCLKHKYFENYEENLFFMTENKNDRLTDRSNETKKAIDKIQFMEASRKGNWGQSEIERVLRYLQTKSLGRIDSEIHEDSQNHLSITQLMKKEFKQYRILWRAIYDHVSALDEVNMATLRFRIRFPGEELPSKQKKKTDTDELKKKVDAPTYILEEAELPQMEMKLKSEKLVSENELRVKLGQFLYLKNLQNVDFGKKGTSNPDPCPVCQGNLGEKWAVFLCGHCFCMNCITILINENPMSSIKGSVRCPMCRQVTKSNDISYVDINESSEENVNVKVSGSLSTKIEGVVRTMLSIKATDPEAKVLIFSSWNEVLEVIADGLAHNGITHRILQSSSKFQVTLSSFKTKREITALLLPLSSGANGLNLIEAHHVLLVEPILNSAAEVQAIGRIHRIGQNKATFVHRFIVRSTIEERMYNILHPKYLEGSAEDNSLTIEDLDKFFIPSENASF